MKKKLIIIGCIFIIILILLGSFWVFYDSSKSNNNYLDLFSNNISILAVIPSPKTLYKNNPMAFQIIQYIPNGNNLIISKAVDWNNPCGYCKLDDNTEWYFVSIANEKELREIFLNTTIYCKNNYCIWNSNNNNKFELPNKNDITLRHDPNLKKIFDKIGEPNELFLYTKIKDQDNNIEDISINFIMNDKNEISCHGYCNISNESSLKRLCKISQHDISQDDTLIFKYIPDNPSIASVFSLNLTEQSDTNKIMQYIFKMSSLHDYYQNNAEKEDKNYLETFFKDIEELLDFKYKLNIKIDNLLQQLQGDAVICVYDPETIQTLEPSKKADLFSLLMIYKLSEKKELSSTFKNLKLSENTNSEGIYLTKEKEQEIYKIMIKPSAEHTEQGQCIYFSIIDNYYFCLSSELTLIKKAQEKSSHFNEFLAEHNQQTKIPHYTIIQIDKLGKQIIQWLKQNQNNSSLDNVLEYLNKVLEHFSFLTFKVFNITEDLQFESKIQIKDTSWNILFNMIHNIEKEDYNINNSVQDK